MAFVTEYLVQQNAGTFTSILTTELNSLANGSVTLASVNGNGGVFNNQYGTSGAGQIGGWPLTTIELRLAAIASNRTANGGVNVWLLRSLDGITYETGSNTIAPIRNVNVVLATDATSNAYTVSQDIALPPGQWKPIAQNETGVAFAASGNTLNISPYSDQVG